MPSASAGDAASGSAQTSQAKRLRQVRKLKAVLRTSPNTAWLILLHHQLVEYPVSGIRLSDRIGLALVNAADVLAAIAPHSSRTLILHGHRHINWIGTTGDAVLCSAPSTTLGPANYRQAFTIHEFALAEKGKIQLAANITVSVTNNTSEPGNKILTGEAA